MTQTISLEFLHEHSDGLAAMGSDSVTFLDGRWNGLSRTFHIHDKLSELRSQRPHIADMLFVGYSRLGANDQTLHRMADPNPPAWATDGRRLPL